MIINGIEFEFLGDSFYIEGHGRSYIAKLKGKYKATQIREALLGERIPGGGKKILGVEMFAIESQNDTTISIVFDN